MITGIEGDLLIGFLQWYSRRFDYSWGEHWDTKTASRCSTEDVVFRYKLHLEREE